MSRTIVVFAPHPDDETFGCGGTIAQRLNEGYDVSVVFLTDGRHALEGHINTKGPTPLEIKAIRKEEAIRATKILGIPEENLVFLDYEDKTLKENECLAQEKIVRILQALSPAEVFFPQEKEYHVDHRITNQIVRKALETFDSHPVEYRYIIAWSFPFYLYQHIMPKGMFDRVVTRFSKCNLIEVDISKAFPLKEKAIKEYRSQILLMFTGQRRPVLKHSFVKRFLRSEESYVTRKDAK